MLLMAARGSDGFPIRPSGIPAPSSTRTVSRPRTDHEDVGVASVVTPRSASASERSSVSKDSTLKKSLPSISTESVAGSTSAHRLYGLQRPDPVAATGLKLLPAAPRIKAEPSKPSPSKQGPIGGTSKEVLSFKPPRPPTAISSRSALGQTGLPGLAKLEPSSGQRYVPSSIPPPGSRSVTSQAVSMKGFGFKPQSYVQTVVRDDCIDTKVLEEAHALVSSDCTFSAESGRGDSVEAGHVGAMYPKAAVVAPRRMDISSQPNRPQFKGLQPPSKLRTTATNIRFAPSAAPQSALTRNLIGSHTGQSGVCPRTESAEPSVGLCRLPSPVVADFLTDLSPDQAPLVSEHTYDLVPSEGPMDSSSSPEALQTTCPAETTFLNLRAQPKWEFNEQQMEQPSIFDVVASTPYKKVPGLESTSAELPASPFHVPVLSPLVSCRRSPTAITPEDREKLLGLHLKLENIGRDVLRLRSQRNSLVSTIDQTVLEGTRCCSLTVDPSRDSVPISPRCVATLLRYDDGPSNTLLANQERSLNGVQLLGEGSLFLRDSLNFTADYSSTLDFFTDGGTGRRYSLLSASNHTTSPFSSTAPVVPSCCWAEVPELVGNAATVSSNLPSSNSPTNVNLTRNQSYYLEPSLSPVLPGLQIRSLSHQPAPSLFYQALTNSGSPSGSPSSPGVSVREHPANPQNPNPKAACTTTSVVPVPPPAIQGDQAVHCVPTLQTSQERLVSIATQTLSLDLISMVELVEDLQSISTLLRSLQGHILEDLSRPPSASTASPIGQQLLTSGTQEMSCNADEAVSTGGITVGGLMGFSSGSVDATGCHTTGIPDSAAECSVEVLDHLNRSSTVLQTS